VLKISGKPLVGDPSWTNKPEAGLFSTAIKDIADNQLRELNTRKPPHLADEPELAQVSL